MDVSLVRNFRIALRPSMFDERIPKSIGEVPGRMWHREKRVWTVPISSIDKLAEKLLHDKVWNEDDVRTVRGLVNQLIDHTKTDISLVKQNALIPLREYQEDTLKFFINRGSALGALDMATGKTFTSLAYYFYLMRTRKIEKCLMVVPVSAMFHWYRESKKFFGKELNNCIVGYEFDAKGNPKIISREDRLNQLKSTEYNGFIINYEKVKDIVDHPDVLNSWSSPHNYLTIADEVTRVKTWSAQRTKALKALPSTYRVGLSGRPIENNIMEYFTILDWIWPKCLGSWGQFKDKFTVTDHWGKAVGYRDLEVIRSISSYIAIQYKLNDVQPDLPPVMKNQYDVNLSSEEEKEYEKISNAIDGAIEVMKGGENNQGMMNVLSLFQMSLMFCDHPTLVRNSDSMTAKQLGIVINKSSKLEEFRIILDEILARKGKVVVFSHFKKMLDLLEIDIKRIYPLINVYKYAGGSTPFKRQQLIDAFTSNQNPSVFLSTDAGTYAIELQCASYIINYDLAWNPAVIDQRIARLHRPGQKNPVMAINMVVKGPDKVEERVLEILQKKELLYDEVLGDSMERPETENEITFGTVKNQA